jgi:hypothetical protein
LQKSIVLAIRKESNIPAHLASENGDLQSQSALSKEEESEESEE